MTGIVTSSPLPCQISTRGRGDDRSPQMRESRGQKRRAGLHGLVLIDGKQHRVPRVLSRIPLCRPGHRSGGKVWGVRIPFPNVSREFSRRRARGSGEKRRARESKRTFRTCRTLWWVRSAVSRFPWRRSGRVWRGRGLTVHVDSSCYRKKVTAEAGTTAWLLPRALGAGEENVRRTARRES